MPALGFVVFGIGVVFWMWIVSHFRPLPSVDKKELLNLKDMDTSHYEGPTEAWSPHALLDLVPSNVVSPTEVRDQALMANDEEMQDNERWRQLWRDADSRIEARRWIATLKIERVVPGFRDLARALDERDWRMAEDARREVALSSDTIMFYTAELEALLNA